MKLTTHPHLVAEVKNVWSYTSAPRLPSWRGYEKLIFYSMKIRLGLSFPHAYNTAFLLEPLTM